MNFCWRAAIVLAIGFAANATRADPVTVVLGTATAGGGFELYGRHFAEVIGEADPSLKVELRATRGSSENVPLLEAGKLDIGLVEGNAAHIAFEGIGRPKTRLRILAAMYPAPGMFVVRADSPVQRIGDLKGKPVALGTRNSGLTILGRDVLDGLGIDADKDIRPVYLEKAGDGPKHVLEGKVAALWGGGIGWPGFRAVASANGGARFIVPDGDEIARIQARHPQLRRMTVPAGTYPGQSEPIHSVGLWSYVLVRADFPEALAHRLLRAIHRGEPALARRLPQGAYTTAANTAGEIPRIELLHPGASQYLREIRALP